MKRKVLGYDREGRPIYQRGQKSRWEFYLWKILPRAIYARLVSRSIIKQFKVLGKRDDLRKGR